MQIYNLPLSNTGQPLPAGQGQFILLPQPVSGPYILRLVVFSTSAIVNQGVVHCNIPPKDVEFNRFKFYTYPINASFHQETHIDIEVHTSGAFSYFITYLPIKEPYFDLPNGSVNTTDFEEEKSRAIQEIEIQLNGHDLEEKDEKDTSDSALSSEDPSVLELRRPQNKYLAIVNENADVTSLQEDPETKIHDILVEDYARSCTQKFYFIVSAGFQLDGEPLALNSLNIESVISKWMGPKDTWREKFKLIKDKGYNMIHFTPLQARGESNSPYSIYDQLAFDAEHFPNGEADIKDMVHYLEHELKLLSMTDIVFNHTANNSDWLKDHPEAGYSAKTAPHLKPAIDLDNALLEFSANMGALGYPTQLNSTSDLDRVMEGIKTNVFPAVRLWEYYVVDVEFIKKKVLEAYKISHGRLDYNEDDVPKLEELKKLAKFAVDHSAINFEALGRERFGRTINALKFIEILKVVIKDEEPSDKTIGEVATKILNEINLPLYKEYDEDVATIESQLYNRITYTRIDDNGPKLGPINEKNPLIETYFTRVRTRPHGEIVELANNGWIWNGDPLVDFASDRSKAYLKREVIIWGDCVKLRYGSQPKDSPYLWDRMTKYTQLMAKYFHGFRVDNCHSTPLHVGEYFLDKARLVRNNLYVAAELFTGSEDMDRIFVERLGITSLIREAMQAWSVGELSRLVHRHGGRPIGSFSKQPVYTFSRWSEDEAVHLVNASNIHALFMDCTHDNEMPAQKRTVEDTLPNAALVSMCACAVGSVMGFDEGYPKLLEIVTEPRLYTFGTGISEIKKQLYDVHTQMGQDSVDEMHVHHEGQYITVHRVNSITGEGWFLIARTKFSPEGDQKSK